MNRITHTFAIFAAVSATASVAVATAPGLLEEVIYEFNDDLYYPGSPQVIIDLGIGPARLVELEWQGVMLETYNNIGVPNWANEAWFGFRGTDLSGSGIDILTQPFPDSFQDGIVGPTSGSLDLTLLDLFSSAEGTVAFLVASNWDDGSGLAAGAFLSGQLTLRYQSLVPAPSSLLVVVLALGLKRRRRR
jgi:hypothetical protein